ncbi:MAG: radical SAM protein [Patescibacteria group bacterium]|jgi:sulfatase maturation enzyme AslB (radical SAM superfamily)
MHIKQFIGAARLFIRSCREFAPGSLYIFLKNHIIRRTKNILRIKEETQPDILGIEITTYCPWRCKDCYVPVELRKDRTVIEEDLLSLTLTQTRKYGIRLYGYMGGEPMREDTIPLILKVASQNRDLTFIICTNGYDIARHGASQFINAPNVGVLLSFDGFEETNDGIRGRGSYKNVMQAASQLNQLKRIFGASITVRRENIDEVLSTDFISHLSNQGFKYVALVKYCATDEAHKDCEVTDNEIISRLAQLRMKTMTWPIFLQTNLVGDFFSFNRRSAHHTIYLGIRGDIYVKRENMLLPIGNVWSQTFEGIMTENTVVYGEKYYPINL